MCLIIHQATTDAVKKKTGKFTAYKIYRRQVKGDVYVLMSPYIGEVVESSGVVSAVKKATSYSVVGTSLVTTLSEDEQRHGVVNFGIHVFTSKRIAEQDVSGWLGKYNLVVIPVICEYEDVRAVGTPSAPATYSADNELSSVVLTKITIDQRVWDAALKMGSDFLNVRTVDAFEDFPPTIDLTIEEACA